MKLVSDSVRSGHPLPAEFAFCRLDHDGKVVLSANRNPHLAWTEVPVGAASLVLLCIDGDAPLAAGHINHVSRANDASRADVVLPASAPRGDFFHWSLVDIPLSLRQLPAGALADGVTPRGKPEPDIVVGDRLLRQGLNDYTGAYAADPAMAGDYYGYDGPCPPSNDERVHHYIFRLYALDVPRLDLPPRFTCADVLNAIHGHIIDEAQLITTYTLNPSLAPKVARSKTRTA